MKQQDKSSKLCKSVKQVKFAGENDVFQFEVASPPSQRRSMYLLNVKEIPAEAIRNQLKMIIASRQQNLRFKLEHAGARITTVNELDKWVGADEVCSLCDLV